MYAEENHPASDIKEEINVHVKQKQLLEVNLPSSVVIGPFFVNVESLKQTLIEKRQMLIESLLTYLAERLAEQIETVS